jgi:hypothetical protein
MDTKELIQKHAIEKGVELAGKAVVYLVKEIVFGNPDSGLRSLIKELFLSGPNNSSILDSRLQEMNDKLDSLISAPYKNAQLYLRTNRLDKAETELIDAIHKDPLNLMARIMLIQLLTKNEYYDEAVRQYWSILHSFGLREDIVPKWIIDLYKDYISEGIKIAEGGDAIKICPECAGVLYNRKGHVNQVWFSQNCCAVQWKVDKEEFPTWKKILRPISAITTSDDRYALGVFNISNNTVIMKTKLDNSAFLSEVRVLTNEYIVVGNQLYSSVSGKSVRDGAISNDEFALLFSGSSSNTYGSISVPTETVSVKAGNVLLEINDCHHTETIVSHPDTTATENDYYIQSLVLRSIKTLNN